MVEYVRWRNLLIESEPNSAGMRLFHYDLQCHLPEGFRLLEPKEWAGLLIEYERGVLSRKQKRVIESIENVEFLGAGFRVGHSGLIELVASPTMRLGPPVDANGKFTTYIDGSTVGEYDLGTQDGTCKEKYFPLTVTQVNDRCPALVRDFWGVQLSEIPKRLHSINMYFSLCCNNIVVVNRSSRSREFSIFQWPCGRFRAVRDLGDTGVSGRLSLYTSGVESGRLSRADEGGLSIVE